MLRTVGWAIYLACSWTWCIGMFLPSLLVRDGGLPFFWAFLIPNVLGAASVGWVLCSVDRSRRFVASLRPILLIFTGVTISFHAYWLIWRAGHRLLQGEPQLVAGIACGAAIVLLVLALRRRVDWLPALVTLFISVSLGVVLLSLPPPEFADVFGAELLGLAMVTVLGFGLCPYLDLTFNRAAQRASNPRAAFTIGFLVVFAAIILVSTQGRVVWMPGEPIFAAPRWALLLAVGGHFGAQAAFTVAAHVSSLGSVGTCETATRACDRSLCLRRYVFVPATAGVVLALGAFWFPVEIANDAQGPMNSHEVLYRMYLGCYGLVFPAWMLLSLGGRNPVGRRTLTLLVITCLLAAPFFWMGMIERREVWLIPGVMIVLLARLFVGSPETHDRTV